jgi:hypothetical protein
MVSISLLAFVFLPFLGLYFERLKAGECELYFRSLPLSDQLLTFIKSISKDKTWTFYSPREHEKPLGEASKLLVEELLKEDYNKLHMSLQEWLESEDSGLKWMASEIIGFFSNDYKKLLDLKQYLVPLYKDKNINEPWATWQLNACWAYSKIDNNYIDIHDFLLQTKNEDNQAWILDVYEQMPLKKHAAKDDFIKVINKFLSRPDLEEAIKEKAKEKIAKLKQVHI